MDPNVIEQTLEEVPAEIRAAIQPLSKDKSWAVFIVLLKKENMRFSQIKDYFKTESPGEIDRILRCLAAAGLIAKKAINFDDLDRPTGFRYSPTDLGKSVMDGLFNGVFGVEDAGGDRPVVPTAFADPQGIPSPGSPGVRVLLSCNPGMGSALPQSPASFAQPGSGRVIEARMIDRNIRTGKMLVELPDGQRVFARVSPEPAGMSPAGKRIRSGEARGTRKGVHMHRHHGSA